MGKERQIIEFILEGSHKKLTSSLDKAQSSLDDLATKTDRLFLSNVAKAGSGIIGATMMLTNLAGKAIAPFAEHVGNMEQYRKEAGLTQGEIADFSAEVISSSTKYGVALSRVSTMATFVGKGLGESREKAVQLSAAMTDLGDFTNATDETLGDLSRDLTRLFNVEVEKAQNLMYGLTQVAKDSHAPLEDVAAALAMNEEAMRALPIEESTKHFGAFVAGMIESGAEAKHYNEVLNQLGDTNSAARLKFDAVVSAGGGMKEFMQDITTQVSVFRERLQKGTITQAGYNRAIENLSRNFGLSSFTMEKMSESWGVMSDRTRAFDAVQSKSVEENRAGMAARASGLTKFQKKLQEFKGKAMGTFEGLFGPSSAIWGWLGDVLDKVDGLIDRFNVLDPFNSNKLADANIVDFEAKNDQEKLVREKRIIETTANTMRAHGLGLEAAGFEKRALATVQEKYLPSAIAPSPGGGDNSEEIAVMKDIATNIRSMKGSNEEMARAARLNGANAGTGAGGNNKATSASEGIR